MANRAPHPNAAKLLIQWYMGDDKGQLGKAPYFIPGDNDPRKDVPIPPGGKSISDLPKIAWRNDPVFVYANAIQVSRFLDREFDQVATIQEPCEGISQNLRKVLGELCLPELARKFVNAQTRSALV